MRAMKSECGEVEYGEGQAGRPEWRDWVDRGAEYCRTDVAKLVDAALVDYLKQRGFDEPAPKR